MANDIEKLREHLFATLEGLRNEEKPLDVEVAKTVCLVSSEIISSAKAEIEFAKVNGSVDSKFFSKPVPASHQLPSADKQSSAGDSSTKVTELGNHRVIEHRAK